MVLLSVFSLSECSDLNSLWKRNRATSTTACIQTIVAFSVGSTDKSESVPQPGVKTASQERQFTRHNLQTTTMVGRGRTLWAKSHCKMDIWNQPRGFLLKASQPLTISPPHSHPSLLGSHYPMCSIWKCLAVCQRRLFCSPLLPLPGTTCSDRTADLRSCQVGSRFST